MKNGRKSTAKSSLPPPPAKRTPLRLPSGPIQEEGIQEEKIQTRRLAPPAVISRNGKQGIMPSPEKKSTPARQLAELLYSGLRRIDALRFNIDIGKWPKTIQYMLSSGITYEQMESAINDLIKHYHEEYCPKIRSAQQLKDKWTNLRDFRIKEGLIDNEPIADESAFAPDEPACDERGYRLHFYKPDSGGIETKRTNAEQKAKPWPANWTFTEEEDAHITQSQIRYGKRGKPK